MSEDIYDLAGPFAEAVRRFEASELQSFNVKLKVEGNKVHPLNPVGQLRRVISAHHDQDAILFVTAQFLDVFTVVSEQQTDAAGQRASGLQLKSRLRSVATTAAGHLPKRLRKSGEGDASHEVEDLVNEADTEEFNKLEDTLKDFVFSIGVAFAQILKVRLDGVSITIYYHPNTVRSTHSSMSFLSSALRFSFAFTTPAEASSFVEKLQAKLNRYNQAATFLKTDTVIPSEMNIVAVTRPIRAAEIHADQDGELLLAKDAPWGTTVPAPSCWLDKAESTAPLWVYMTTPIGYGKCEIPHRILNKYAKHGCASFFVGVKHPQVQSQFLGTVSHLRRVATIERQKEEAEEDAGDSENEWQPEDSAESSTGISPSSSGKPSAIARRSVRPEVAAMLNGKGGRHVRLHCQACHTENYDKWQPGESQPQTGKSIPPWLQQNKSATAMTATLVLLLCWFVLPRAVLITLLNIAIASLAIWKSQQRQSGVLLNKRKARQTGEWKVTFVKAELISDEPWAAFGESIVAAVEADDSEASTDSRKQQLGQQYGFSQDVVDRYMLAFHDDEHLAHRKMSITYEWRKANQAADILKQPQPHFKFFKGMFHHALLGTTVAGHPIWFMKVGEMKAGHKTFKDSKLSMRDLARHVALCMDYMYEVVETAALPNGRALWVLDLKGMGMTDIGSEAFDLGKEIAGMIAAHWPERLYRAFIINMPGFFSILWKMIEPMMAASTRKKIRLLRGKQNMLKEMTEEMAIEDIPVDYGGKLDDVYNAKAEKKFWEYADKLSSQ